MEERLHMTESAVAGKPKIIIPGDPPEAESIEPTPVQIAQETPIVVESIAHPTDVRSVALSGLFLMGFFYSLYFARPVLLPITLALLLNFLLRPIVQRLARWHIPTTLSAVLMLLLLVGSIGGAIYGLSRPAQDWLNRAPGMARDVGKKLQALRKPVQKVTNVAAQVGNLAQGGKAEGSGGEGAATGGQSTSANESNAPQQVHVQKSLFDSGFLASTLSGTQEFIGNVVVVLILLYFLLASGDFFIRKMIKVIPRLSDKKRALKIANEMEHEISRYFLTVTIINACLGAAVGISLYFIGMPAPFLWGATAFVLNFIPYLGALTGIVLTALVALISIDPISHALLAPGAYLLIAILEGNFITPSVMGRNFTLNTVVIFAWLVFWGWLWGIPGALIAVPILSALKIFCDHIDRLHTLGEFLGNSRE